jgi:hypothetical protein
MLDRCVGCGHKFKDGEKPSAGANYGPGETEGPFYWCVKCCPPMSEEGAKKMIEQFIRNQE